MDRRPAGIALFVAALVGMQQYVNSKEKPAGEKNPSHDKVEAHPELYAGLVRICEAFEGGQGASKTSCPETACAGRAFKWVIATVPDPHRTAMRLSFDRYIESVQRAAEDSGYSFERHWLPWRSANEVASSPGASKATSCSRSLPGVLAFRASDSKRPPLLVFLVAETPTTGIDLQQFQSAVEMGRQSTVKGEPLRVIGPSFSGSFASLQRAIGKEERCTAEVITGSATGACARNAFRDAVPKFEAVLHTDRDLLRSLLAHMHSQWSTRYRPAASIAIISEQDTAYGAQFDIKKLGVCDENEDPRKAGLLAGLDKEPILHFIRYPRDISRLRNVYQEPNRSSEKSHSTTDENAPFSFKDAQEGSDMLPSFSKQHMPVSQDAIMAAIASSLRQERVRYAIITASDTLDLLFVTRYLRSTAPDVRLFTLGTESLFAHGSDAYSYGGILAAGTYPLVPANQHWTSPEGFANARSFFSSTYTQATYNAARVILSRSSGKPVELTEYRPPFQPGNTPGMWLTSVGVSGYAPVALLPPSPVPDPVLYRTPVESQKVNPAVVERPSIAWMTMYLATLAGALVLLVLVNHPASVENRTFALFALKHHEHAGRAERGFYLLCLHFAVSLLVCVFTYPSMLLVLHGFGFDPVAKAAAVAWFLVLAAGATATASSSDKPRREMRRIRPWTVAGLMTAVVLLAVAAWLGRAVPNWTLKSGTPIWAIMASGLGLITSSALVFSGIRAIVALSLRPCQAVSRRSLKTMMKTYIPPASVAALTITFVACAVFCLSASEEQAFFFAFRSFALATGTSPLVPFLLLSAALCYWAIAHLRRVTYHEDRCPILPILRGDTLCPGLVHTENEIKMHIRRPFYNGLETRAGILLIPTLAALFPFTTSTQMYEHFSIEIAYFVLLLTTTVLTIYSWARFLLLWKLLREFLQQLERHPIRFAFDSLRAAYSWAPVWQQGGGKRRTHVVFTRSLECLRRMKQLTLPPMTRVAVEDTIAAVEGPLRALLEKSAKRQRIVPAEYRDIQSTFSNIGSFLAGALESSWSTGDPQKTFSTEDRGMSDNASFVMHQYLALRFLPYITYVQLQLQNLLLCATTMFVLSVLSMQSYPFQSQYKLGWIWTIMFLVFGSGIVAAFMQIERDPILSRIAGTEAGKLDSGFLKRILTYGAIPLLTLIASQFPSVGRHLMTWMEPAMQMLR